MPSFAEGWFKNVRPGKDSSPYRERIDTISLPANTETRVFVGDAGTVVPESYYSSADFQAIVDRLNAEMVFVEGADHMSVLYGAADRLAAGR